MSENPYAPDFEGLPETIPIFPLHGVLLLPKGQLPLNVFEERYLAMVEDAMRSHRLIGIIQPENSNGKSLFKTGCAGKITGFQETGDGRFLITLTGICRFNVMEELHTTTAYRQVVPDWSAFKNDIGKRECLNLNREHLMALLKSYFEMHELTCSWEHIENASDEKLITCLSMICPLEPGEKQVLLEAQTCEDRGSKFLAILEMAVKSASNPASGKCH